MIKPDLTGKGCYICGQGFNKKSQMEQRGPNFYHKGCLKMLAKRLAKINIKRSLIRSNIHE